MSLAGAPESAVEPVLNGNLAGFDLESFISRYAPGSETRLQRLVFIAQHTSDNALKQSCLQLLETQLREAGNVTRYSQVMPNPDTEWVAKQTSNNEATLEVLEARLSAAQANLNKDAIRNCYLNLGDFHAKTGQPREALKNVLRARDYCNNRAQTGQICWKVIELAMNLSNYSQVRDYAIKAEHAVVTGDVDFPLKLKVAAGMSLLGDGQYKEACQKLKQVKVPPEDVNMLASPEDVALYSSLLALATLDRAELVHYLEDQPTVLELVPSIRDALRHYVRADYKSCLSTLHSSPLLGMDVLLAPHAKKLVEMIRNRSFVDYLQPYNKVSLAHMATMFGETTETVTATLAQLIGNGSIRHARIDCRTQTLQRDSPVKMEKARLAKTEKRVERLQESVLNDAHAAIVRLACIEYEPQGERGAFNAAFAAANPEDVLEGIDDSDDEMEMVLDNMANPDDAAF